MELKEIHRELKKIEAIIQENYPIINDTGVLVGLSGMSLFQFHLYEYFNDSDSLDLGHKILERGINQINKQNFYPTYCSGLAGFGWVIDYLSTKGIVNIDNDGLLSNLDSYLFSQMLSDLKIKNYDFLHGATGYALYFLNRYYSTSSLKLKSKYEEYLNEYFVQLVDFSIQIEHNMIGWLRKKSKNSLIKYDLGLSHGQASLIAILTKLHKINNFKNDIKPILEGSINFLMANKSDNMNNLSIFPDYIGKGKITYRSRLAWCYGDLGIAISLLNAGIELQNEELYSFAIATLLHSSQRKEHVETWANEASICHGFFGISHIYSKGYSITSNQVFKRTADYWFDTGLSYIQNRVDWKDFSKNINADKLSLLEGYAGAGLVMLSHIMEKELSWDQSLLLN